jgi:hypothetical protein
MCYSEHTKPRQADRVGYRPLEDSMFRRTAHNAFFALSGLLVIPLTVLLVAFECAKSGARGLNRTAKRLRQS